MRAQAADIRVPSTLFAVLPIAMRLPPLVPWLGDHHLPMNTHQYAAHFSLFYQTLCIQHDQ